MTHLNRSPRILVIDHHLFWRQLSTRALSGAGYVVEDCEDYRSALLQKDKSDLVILSCANVGDDEQRLITQLLKERAHLLVLSSYLSRSVMRSLYLQGVDDITDKPYDPVSLVTLVEQLLQKIASNNTLQLIEEKV